MALTIGVNVVEVDGAATPAIVGAAFGVGAFNIATQRGAPNAPARVTSFAEFQTRFGGFDAAALGPYLVKGFFDNGGQVAWINRVTAADASPSRTFLRDGAGENTLRLRSGMRGVVDPGTWGGDLAVRVTPSSSFSSRFLETAPAMIQGEPLGEAVDMTGAAPLSVIVDGEPGPTTIAFQAGDFTPASARRTEIRDAINARQTKVIASLSADNRLVLTSSGETARRNATFTSLRLTAAHAKLELAATPDTVFGTPAARTAGGTRLARVDGLQAGSVLRLRDGDRTAVVKLQSVVPGTNTVQWAPEVANIGDFSPTGTVLSTPEFDLAIAKGGSTEEEIVETFTGLTMEADLPSFAPNVLNDDLTGSRYLVGDDRNSPSAAGADLPAATNGFVGLTPGTSGTATALDFVGDAAARTGFSAFDPRDVQLLCCERTDPTVVTAGLAYCENRGDCLYVGSVPERFVGAGQAIAYGKAFQGAKVYGALYGPWIKVLDPLASGTVPARWVPPTGHVMGIYARIASARGIWKAPAGDEARLLGALDVETMLSDLDHTELVKAGSVNGIRPIPGAGICVDASRSLSTDTRWLYVNVRLLFNYVKSSLRGGLRWVRQEPNRDTLWTAVKHGSVTPFLMQLWRQGAFGTGEPDQVFTVICDETNNPPDQVDQGILTVEVYFYPSRPAETIVIKIGQQPSGATAAEA